ncbi:MAG: type II secretion system protein [Microgenomates group bacterium]|jgi:prepilin-type N-terminal cleavage/methylation domain-containing protein
MKKSFGFTLVEILLVMGLFAILASFITINLIRPQTKASVEASINTLAADLKEAQLKSMIGDSEGQTTAQSYGIFFTSNSYTIFRGTTYNSGDTSNFIINLDTSENLVDTFSGHLVVFERRSGEVVSFVNGSNTITISDNGGNSKTITVNNLGVISVN